MPGVNSGNQIVGVEIDVDELSGGVFPAHSPYLGFAGPVSVGLGISSGGGTSTTFPATVGISIGNNTAAFETGIQFSAHSIYGDDGVNGAGEAIALAKGHVINWYAYDPTQCAPTPCGFVDAFIRMDSTSHNDPIGLAFTDGVLSLTATTAATFKVAIGLAGQQSTIELADFGGAGYDIQKDGPGNFEIFDKLNSLNIIQYNNSNEELTLGVGGNSSVFINANALVFPYVQAPTTPPVGFFYEYVDAVDGKLKAKGPSGTVTTLANP